MNSRRVTIILVTLALTAAGMAALFGLLQSGRAQANPFTLYVSPDANCGVVLPCYGSIQAAVDAADDGNIIKVSQGTYTNTGENIVAITKSITLLGGFSTVDWGSSSAQDQPTVLDGEDERRGIYIYGVDLDPITLAGLTIKNGHTLTGGGSGILIITSTVDVADSLISGGDATQGADNFGGGVAIIDSVVEFAGNTIFDNKAGAGAGVSVNNSDVNMSGSEIRGNIAITGGGLHVVGESFVTMSGNKIINNRAKAGRGPGILLAGSSTIEAVNDIIADNGDSQGDGEGVNVWSGNLVALHWTLANNDAIGLVASNGSVDLTNTIVAFHSTAGLFGSFVTSERTLFFGNGANCTSGATCTETLVGNPLFVDPSKFDYHITHRSAAVDAGIDAFVWTDIDGEIRPAGVASDIGADEIQLITYLPLAAKSK